MVLYNFGYPTSNLDLADSTIYPTSTGTISDGFFSQRVFNLGTPPASLTSFNLYNTSATDGLWVGRFNGAFLFGSNSAEVNVAGGNLPPTQTTWMLGSDPSQVNFFDGDIAEILFYNRALSDAERFVVGSYLQNKFNLPNTQVPATPSGLSIQLSPYGDVLLTWNNTPNAALYSIERSVNGGPWEPIGLVGGTSAPEVFADSSYPSGGGTFQYEVSAVSFVGQSAYSAPVLTLSPDSVDPSTGIPYWLEGVIGNSPLPNPPTQVTPPNNLPGSSLPTVTITIPSNATFQ